MELLHVICVNLLSKGWGHGQSSSWYGEQCRKIVSDQFCFCLVLHFLFLYTRRVVFKNENTPTLEAV